MGYKVVLERNGDAETLGLTIVGMADMTLLVQGLHEEGLVSAFNKTVENTPEGQVNAGDFIVAVNTVFGDLEAMWQQLQEETVNLTMKRKDTLEYVPAASERQLQTTVDVEAASNVPLHSRIEVKQEQEAPSCPLLGVSQL